MIYKTFFIDLRATNVAVTVNVNQLIDPAKTLVRETTQCLKSFFLKSKF